MVLQPFTLADVPVLQDLQPEGWDNLTPIFNYYLRSDFCYPLKIVIDNKVIGTGVSIIHDDVAWLAHIIVHKDHRNKGVGQQITQHLINSIPTHCKTIYLIATDMGEPVYKKLGFIAEADYAFLNKGSFGTFTSSDNVTPFEAKHEAEILAIDKAASGENRAMHFSGHLQDSFVYVVNDKVEGYYLPAFGNGLIVAINPTAGIEMMKLRSKKSDTFILPKDNKAAVDCLVKNNYNLFRIAKRMRLGAEIPWQPKNIYNRVSGQIG